MTDQIKNPSPEAIESNIERTRADMSSTIEAIQNKLTPKELANQAVDYALNTRPGAIGANIVNTVRENPVPVAMIGIGIAWLMRATRQTPERTQYRRQTTVRSTGYYPEDELAYDSASRLGYADTTQGSTSEGVFQRAATKASDTASELKDKASQTASNVSERARQASDRARTKLRQTTDEARQRVSQLGQQSQQQYYRARERFDQLLDEQPLIVGGIGVAVGAALGATLPVTQRENELLGPTRDNLMGRAAETVRQQAENVKQSAQRVVQSTKETAKQEADQLKENIASTASQGSGQSQSIPPGNANSGQFSGSNFPS